ncbi:MAG: methionine biosynthesis protein MetW [Armatimonadota bacterium]
MADSELNILNDRPDLRPIIDLVEPESRVLDLGCGEGHLMNALQKLKRVRAQGIDLSDAAIQSCVEKGLFVYQGDIEEGLADFNDGSVDYVILTDTIQVLRRPAFLLKEAARVGKKVIVSVPNFGYWRVRLQLMFLGKMPRTRDLPYEWYDSPNIHLTTIQSFREFCSRNGLRIIREADLVLGGPNPRKTAAHPNFFANYAIFIVENDSK